MKTSLIISVYKRADFLALVLESVLRQNLMPDEVLVSEDGESPEIKEIVAQYRDRLTRKTSFQHLQQKDLGNRKPLALNRAISASTGDYLIFIDGDCVLRDDFVKAHLEFQDDKSFLTGRRVELSQSASRTLSLEKLRNGYLAGWPLALYWDAVFGNTRSLGRMFRTPKFLRHFLGRHEVHDIRGCNFSVARKHLERINGFCNNFSGAYGEDSDVEIRLRYLGLKMKSVKNAAIQYHLWHREQVKDPGNQEKLAALAQSSDARTSDGLNEITNYP